MCGNSVVWNYNENKAFGFGTKEGTPSQHDLSTPKSQLKL